MWVCASEPWRVSRPGFRAARHLQRRAGAAEDCVGAGAGGGAAGRKSGGKRGRAEGGGIRGSGGRKLLPGMVGAVRAAAGFWRIDLFLLSEITGDERSG